MKNDLKLTKVLIIDTNTRHAYTFHIQLPIIKSNKIENTLPREIPTTSLKINLTT